MLIIILYENKIYQIHFDKKRMLNAYYYYTELLNFIV